MIIIYSKENCPQCDTASGLLTSKGVPFEIKKLDVDFTIDELTKIIAPVIPRAFPQIVIQNDDMSLAYLGVLPQLIKYLKTM